MAKKQLLGRPGFNQVYVLPLEPDERRFEALMILAITVLTALLLRI